LNDHICPSHFFFFYSLSHTQSFTSIYSLSSECENESKKEILDRSIDRSFHCIVIIFLLYIYMARGDKRNYQSTAWIQGGKHQQKNKLYDRRILWTRVDRLT
jgi:hypothetical protein